MQNSSDVVAFKAQYPQCYRAIAWLEVICEYVGEDGNSMWKTLMGRRLSPEQIRALLIASCTETAIAAEMESPDFLAYVKGKMLCSSSAENSEK